MYIYIYESLLSGTDYCKEFYVGIGVFSKTEAAFGKVDIFVNTAGIINEINWHRMMEVNFVSEISILKFNNNVIHFVSI